MRNGAECLGNRFRFTDATRFNHDVVEALHLHDFEHLLYQVCLQRTADTAILQSYQAVVFLSHHATFLYKVCINVHFAYVIDDNGKLNATFIRKDVIYQRRFATTQITGQQQYGDFYCIHNRLVCFNDNGLLLLTSAKLSDLCDNGLKKTKFCFFYIIKQKKGEKL